MTYTTKRAIISKCGLYRYWLERVWEPNLETLVFLMLNPSTADSRKDDQTIKKCVSIANSSGYGRLVVVNLFAYRATASKHLKEVADPIGPHNDKYILKAAQEGTIICAWGRHSKFNKPGLVNRPAKVVRWLRRRRTVLYCLRLTNKGEPYHPLLLSSMHPIMKYEGEGY